MNITVFGASGKTGRQIIRKGLSLGHTITAYVRRKDSIELEDPKLKIIVGNLNDADKLKEAIRGADACISALGGSSLRKRSIEVTDGISTIIKLMEELGVSRFIYLSSIGAGESRFFMPGFTRFLVCDIFLRIPLADHTLNEENLKKSKLNWTIVRPGGLTEGAETGDLKFGNEKIMLKGNPKISRANVASFMLEQCSATHFGKSAVWLHE